MSKNKPYNTDQNNKDYSEIESTEPKPIFKSAIDFLQRKPERTWGWMVGLLIACIIANLLFSLFYKPKVKSTAEALENTEISIDPISQGVGKIVQAGSSINETMTIKGEIDILLSKESLSHQDSIKLLSLFQQLEHINKKLLPVQKEKK